jgi:hypothetical protein
LGKIVGIRGRIKPATFTAKAIADPGKKTIRQRTHRVNRCLRERTTARSNTFVRPLGVESDVTNFSLLKQLNRIGRELRIGGHNSKVFFNTLSNQQTIEWVFGVTR